MEDDEAEYIKVGLDIIEVDGVTYPALPVDFAVGDYILDDCTLYKRVPKIDGK